MAAEVGTNPTLTELATVSEKIGSSIVHTPTSSRLKMFDDADQLALAYNSFFGVLEVLPVSDKRQEFRFVITRDRWPKRS